MTSRDIVPAEVIEGRIVNEGYIEYDSNNSGGYWWLSDEDWFALEDAGWEVAWVDQTGEQPRFMGPAMNYGNPRPQRVEQDERYMRALATKARIRGVSMNIALAMWKDATGEDPDDEGCNCCGPPHSFNTLDAEGNWTWQ